jgi:hypothetical protein
VEVANDKSDTSASLAPDMSVSPQGKTIKLADLPAMHPSALGDFLQWVLHKYFVSEWPSFVRDQIADDKAAEMKAASPPT